MVFTLFDQLIDWLQRKDQQPRVESSSFLADHQPMWDEWKPPMDLTTKEKCFTGDSCMVPSQLVTVYTSGMYKSWALWNRGIHLSCSDYRRTYANLFMKELYTYSECEQSGLPEIRRSVAVWKPEPAIKWAQEAQLQTH